MVNRFSEEDKGVTRLLEKVKRLFKIEQCSYEWNQVESIVVRDPELFESGLKRASQRLYVKDTPKNERLTLWMACNICETLEKAPRCYFCSRQLTRDNFINDGVCVPLEHFIPRDDGGSHTPANLTLACRICNSIKSNLTDDDFRLILKSPDNFFALKRQRVTPEKKQELIDFAEIYYPRISNLRDYAVRHGIDPIDARKHWENKQSEFRDKYPMDAQAVR